MLKNNEITNTNVIAATTQSYMNYEYMINYKGPKMAPIKTFKSMILTITISYNIHQHG